MTMMSQRFWVRAYRAHSVIFSSLNRAVYMFFRSSRKRKTLDCL